MAGRVLKLSSVLVRPSDATAYTAGDYVGPVAPALFSFDLPQIAQDQGRIVSAAVSITPASGNLVITALDGILWVWRSVDAPTPVADNATFPLTDAQLQGSVARFNFANTAWTNQLGALVAGTVGYQEMVDAYNTINGSPFSFLDQAEFTSGARNTRTLKAAIQITSAWTPGAVVNTITARLDIELGRD